jgi:hypothetical protein
MHLAPRASRTRRAATAMLLAAATVVVLTVVPAGAVGAATRKGVLADGAAYARTPGYHTGIAVLDTYRTHVGNQLTGLMPRRQFSLTPPRIFRTSAEAGPTGGGNRITIYGEGFTRVRHVLFGRTAGRNLDVISGHVIKVDAPAHPRGQVGLHVVTASGRTLGTHYQFIQPPVVSGLGRHDGAATGGQRLSLSGASFKNVRRVAFGSTRAPDVRVRSPQRIQVVVPKHSAGRVNVRVVTAYGISARSPRNSYRYLAPHQLGLHPSASLRVQTGSERGPALAVQPHVEEVLQVAVRDVCRVPRELRHGRVAIAVDAQPAAHDPEERRVADLLA